MNALRAEHAVDLYRYKAERAKIGKFPDFSGCLEDHARYRKWLGLPPFISHKFRPFGRGFFPDP